jgi:hypothetical protein
MVVQVSTVRWKLLEYYLRNWVCEVKNRVKALRLSRSRAKELAKGGDGEGAMAWWL